MGKNLKLYKTWEKTWNYKRHGKKREIIWGMVKQFIFIGDMVENLKL